MPSLKRKSWREWLAINPCPLDEKGAPCVNDWIFLDAAYFCSIWKDYITPEQAIQYITDALPLTRGEKAHNEVRRAVEKQYHGTKVKSSGTKREKPLYVPTSLTETVADVPSIDETWLAKAVSNWGSR
jgi:hypothetical protein